MLNIFALKMRTRLLIQTQSQSDLLSMLDMSVYHKIYESSFKDGCQQIFVLVSKIYFSLMKNC